MKERFLNALLGIVVIILTTLLLPLYLIYIIFVSVVEAIYKLFQGCADYFEIVKDSLKGDF